MTTYNDWLINDDFFYDITSSYDQNQVFADPLDAPLSDEEILDRMDIKVIEQYLRRRKLEKLEKDLK
jgi:hypothetical protein